MFRKKFFSAMGLIVVATMLLASCATPTQEVVTVKETVKETVVVTEIVEVEKEVQVEKLITPTPLPPTPEPGKKIITWWSHWANEPARRQVIETIIKDYETEHPDVDIIISWWDAAPLTDAVRAVVTAGQGAPDIATDVDLVNMVKAGYVLNIEDSMPWDRFQPGLKEGWKIEGVEGTYNFSPGVQTLMLFYNPAIFDELGIVVPDNFTFTQDEFVDVVKKCSDAGYAGVADSVGNRNYPALFPIWAAMVNLVGREEQNKYDIGLQSWDTPEARQVLNWMDELTKAGMWPTTFSTMTIDEFHVYFHTQQKACMLYVPSWYPGRAFKSEAEGGQSPDFHFKMLRYPLMNGAKYSNQLWTAGDSGYMGLASTPYPDVVKDILAFMVQPKYGALWTALTNIPSSIIYDPVKDWPTDVEGQEKWQWYWAEIGTVYAGMDSTMASGAPCGDFLDARTSALNQGLPQGLLTIDEAIAMVDAKLCK
jgi:ABC-type glycerol-3-phosphate transport system substrate-binding protein